jgi:HSP20 family protein
MIVLTQEVPAMTTVVRWQPLREAAAMQAELSRLMNGLFEGSVRQTQSWVPTLDVWETEDALVYAFDLPGIPQEQIAVEIEEDTLTVSATRERKEEPGDDRYRRFERRFGSFTRSVALPQGVSEEQVAASYRDGVLEIRVPKPELRKPRRIEIGVAGPEAQTIEGSAS